MNVHHLSSSLSSCFSSKLIFKNAEKEDFGTYSVSVTNTEGVSSSYTISAEGTFNQSQFHKDWPILFSTWHAIIWSAAIIFEAVGLR